VTMESDSTFGWLHHRVPAILHDENMIEKWLNCEGGLPARDVLSILKPNAPLSWHPVSSAENNSRVKTKGLNAEINL